ncbi:hypothetical protein O6H91_01G053500 [Diphasiastrum complanatum]|uniref:Uncharacterized protein n=1 Tax=Diphasiastrum complanatum TaxID=34168 RepID=A0ACC2ER13_DIPCM|nr:hypothetical protein O6H91_01G053500 [Diphasiastrum complanatum]
MEVVPPMHKLKVSDSEEAADPCRDNNITTASKLPFTTAGDPRSDSMKHHLGDGASETNVSGEGYRDLEELQILRLEGWDKLGRKIVRIVGKFFPASIIDKGRLKRYIHWKLLKDVKEEPFVIVYFHTLVERRENSPGIYSLRHIYETLPLEHKQRLQAVYFIHPGLRSRLLLGIFGHYFLSERLYWKINYMARVEFLWDHIHKEQLQVPVFVNEHDDELENVPFMDYGFVIDPLQAHQATYVTSTHSRLV